MSHYIDDVVEELCQKDLLVILATGLGLHKLILSFFSSYLVTPSPNSCEIYGKTVTLSHEPLSSVVKVILVLNMSSEHIDSLMQLNQIYFSHVLQMLDANALHDSISRENSSIKTNSLSLYRVDSTTSLTSEQRQKLYTKGGVFFISSRLVVTDILTGRLPPELVDGLIISNVHSLCCYSWNTIFVVRLIREKNQHAFIKAFSDCPERLSYGDITLDRVLRELTLSHVLFLQRWNSSVVNYITSSNEPLTSEVVVSLTDSMKTIQFAIISLIRKGHNHLKSIPYVDLTHISLDECCFKRGWDRQLNNVLEPLWRHLPTQYKALVGGISILRQLLRYLTHLDPITFLNYIDSIQLSNTINQCWLLSSEWDLIVKAARERIYVIKRLTGGASRDKTDILPTLSLKLETPPKWLALKGTIANLAKSLRVDGSQLQIDSTAEKQLYRVLIVVEDIYSVQQLDQVLSIGLRAAKENLLRQFVMKKVERFIQSDGKLLIREPTNLNSDNNSFTCFAHLESILFRKIYEEWKERDNSSIFNTSCSQDTTFDCIDDELTSPSFLNIKVSCFSTHHEFDVFLSSFHPHAVILWSPSLPFIRVLEIYCAESLSWFNQEIQKTFASPKVDKDFLSESHEKITLTSTLQDGCVRPKIQVFLYMFKGSAEHQAFLYTVQKERQVWDSLEKQKKLSVITPDECLLIRDKTLVEIMHHFKPQGSTRQGGSFITKRAKLVDSSLSPPCVVVDLREFKCALPYQLYLHSLRVIPTTLVVGDYVLSRDICIERKSIPDFVSSLISGRLFDQFREMARCYTFPTLLLEFKSQQTFFLESREWTTALSQIKGHTSQYKNLMTKFYVFLLHMPMLRIIWSPTTHFSVYMFLQLKKNREEPDPFRCSVMASNDALLLQKVHNDRVTDILRRFPCITSRVAPRILRSIDSLAQLADLELSQLKSILGETPGKTLYSFLNLNIHSC